MLNSKQRAHLKSLSSTMDVKIIIGKNGVSENLLKQIDDTLNANEIVKLKILKNNLFDNDETISEICEKLKCELVSHMGAKFVLYRATKEKMIKLP